MKLVQKKKIVTFESNLFLYQKRNIYFKYISPPRYKFLSTSLNKNNLLTIVNRRYIFSCSS